MSVKTEWVSFEQNGARHRLYTSRMERARTPLPVVIVIQEIWGTDGHILDVTDRFARAGYLAVAPDLFAVDGRRPESLTEARIEQVKAFLDSLPPTAWHDPVAREAALERQPENAREELRATYADVFARLKLLPQLLEKLQAVVTFLEGYELSGGQKVASIGYCMGGALSLMLAASEPRLAGAVVYYGHLPGKDEIAAINARIYESGIDIKKGKSPAPKLAWLLLQGIFAGTGVFVKFERSNSMYPSSYKVTWTKIITNSI